MKKISLSKDMLQNIKPKKKMSKKQIWITILAACMFAAMLFMRYGVKDTVDTTGILVQSKGIAEGVLDGNTYTLTGIGMELRLPKTFEIVTGKALDSQIKGGASGFYRFAARNSARQEVFTLSVPMVDKGPDTYLNEARDTLKDQRTSIGEVEKLEISGFTFKSLRNEAESEDGKKLVELNLVYDEGGKLFCINSLFLAEDEKTVMEALPNIICKVAPKPAEAPTK